MGMQDFTHIIEEYQNIQRGYQYIHEILWVLSTIFLLPTFISFIHFPTES